MDIKLTEEQSIQVEQLKKEISRLSEKDKELEFEYQEAIQQIKKEIREFTYETYELDDKVYELIAGLMKSSSLGYADIKQSIGLSEMDSLCDWVPSDLEC